MGDLATLATGGVGLGVFVLVIFYLLSSNRADRKEYQEAIDRAEARADRAEQRAREAAAREQGTQTALDEARGGRRTAEDRAAELAREMARYRPDPGAPP